MLRTKPVQRGTVDFSDKVVNNSLGKLILTGGCVLPLGDYILQKEVRELTTVTKIDCTDNLFIVETDKYIYIINKNRFVAIQKKFTYIVLANSILVYNDSKCNVYKEDLTYEDLKYSKLYKFISENQSIIYPGKDNLILSYSNEGKTNYLYFSKVYEEPKSLADRINEIYPSRSGVFIIKYDSNNKINVIDDEVFQTEQSFLVTIRQQLEKINFTKDLTVYPTKEQCIIIDQKNIYLFPLTQIQNMPLEIISNIFLKRIYSIGDICNNIQIVKNDDGNLFTCKYYNIGSQPINQIDNINNPRIFDNGIFDTHTNSFVIPSSSQAIPSHSGDKSNQYLINYVYTLSKIYREPDNILCDYFLKNKNKHEYWSTLCAKYSQTLSFDDKASNKQTFIEFTRNFNGRQDISYARIQLVIYSKCDIKILFIKLKPIIPPIPIKKKDNGILRFIDSFIKFLGFSIETSVKLLRNH